MCLFPARVGISAFNVLIHKSTLPYLCLDLTCKLLCLPPRKRCKDGKWKYQIKKFSIDDNNQSQFCFLRRTILFSLPNWFALMKNNSTFTDLVVYPQNVISLRNRQKFLAINRKNHEDHRRSTLAQSKNVPRSKEDYIAEVSKDIEVRVTKKL